MAQSNGTPVTRRALFALPAVTEPVPGNAGQCPVTEPVTGPVTLPLTPLTVTGNTGEPVTETQAGNAEVVPLYPRRAQVASLSPTGRRSPRMVPGSCGCIPAVSVTPSGPASRGEWLSTGST